LENGLSVLAPEFVLQPLKLLALKFQTLVEEGNPLVFLILKISSSLNTFRKKISLGAGAFLTVLSLILPTVFKAIKKETRPLPNA
jgi:hypothetical protein